MGQSTDEFFMCDMYSVIYAHTFRYDLFSTGEAEMDMKIKKREWAYYEMNHYTGTLDFPCDFCNNNSYDNIQIEKDGHLLVVICKDCFDKVMKEEANE